MSPLKVIVENVEENTSVRINRSLIAGIFTLLNNKEALLAIGELDPEMNVRGGLLKRPAKVHSLEGTFGGGIVDGNIVDMGAELKLERGVIVRGERSR